MRPGSQSIAWQDAGWHVASVDQTADHVVFARGPVGSAPRIGPPKHAPRSTYIDAAVIAAIRAQNGSDRFDRTKLLRLIDELNDNYLRGNGYASHALLRAILDHVPPRLSCACFTATANNDPWEPHRQGLHARKLLDFKMQADDALHRQISASPDMLSLDHMPPRAWVNRLLQECAKRAVGAPHILGEAAESGEVSAVQFPLRGGRAAGHGPPDGQARRVLGLADARPPQRGTLPGPCWIRTGRSLAFPMHSPLVTILAGMLNLVNAGHALRDLQFCATPGIGHHRKPRHPTRSSST